MFFIRVACVNKGECDNVIGCFAGNSEEVSVPFNELEGMDLETYYGIGTAVCPSCQPSCLHATYCDTFKERKCKFVEDMTRCEYAAEGGMTGTCSCGAKHVSIFFVKKGKDFKKDERGNYIRTCQECKKDIDEASKKTPTASTHGEENNGTHVQT